MDRHTNSSSKNIPENEVSAYLVKDRYFPGKGEMIIESICKKQERTVKGKETRNCFLD